MANEKICYFLAFVSCCVYRKHPCSLLPSFVTPRKKGIQEVIRFNASLRMESNEGLPKVCANLPMGSMLHVNCLWMFCYG